jgi:glutamate racemase
VLPPDIKIIDSGIAAANELEGKVRYSRKKHPPEYRYYVSDTPERFAELAERFLGSPLKEIYYFDVDRVWTSEEIDVAPIIM